MIGYPLEELYEEVAFLSYHFGWPHDQVMVMEHADRRAWVERVSAINREINGE